MWIALLIIALVIGYIAGKVDALWRLQQRINTLTPTQRESVMTALREGH